MTRRNVVALVAAFFTLAVVGFGYSWVTAAGSQINSWSSFQQYLIEIGLTLSNFGSTRSRHFLSMPPSDSCLVGDVMVVTAFTKSPDEMPA